MRSECAGSLQPLHAAASPRTRNPGRSPGSLLCLARDAASQWAHLGTDHPRPQLHTGSCCEGVPSSPLRQWRTCGDPSPPSLQGRTAGSPTTAGRQRHSCPVAAPVTRGHQQQARRRSVESRATARTWPQSHPLPRAAPPAQASDTGTSCGRHPSLAPCTAPGLRSSAATRAQYDQHSTAPLAPGSRRRCSAATPPSETMETGGRGTQVPTQAPGDATCLYVSPSRMPPG